MNIYDELRKDHQKVIELLDKLIAAEKSETKLRSKLVDQIRDELVPHARAEEAVLYNSIRDIATAGDVIGHAYREHMETETLLRSLQVTDAVNVSWVNGAKKLKENLQHHIKEEEGKVFSAAQKLFTEEEAVAMGDVFKKMKPLVQDQGFMGQTMDMMVNMMPARLRDAFSRFATQVPGTERRSEAS